MATSVGDVDGRPMKAWLCTAYGGPEVLRLGHRPRPVPRSDEMLVRVRATTVSAGDMRIRASKFPRGYGILGRLAFGIARPRRPVLGADFAGTVEAVGSAVAGYVPGDRVFGMNGIAMGCHAEFVAVKASRAVAAIPAELSFEAAASLCFGGTTAMHFLRKAGLKRGERIAVIGASGAVGSAMMQLAKSMGAVVAGVTSTSNVELVSKLGADEVIDYTRAGFGARLAGHDVIADTVGAWTFRQCYPWLAEHGRFLAVAADLKGQFTRPAGTKRSIAGVAAERAEDVAELARLAAGGALIPVIDRIFEFARLPEAHALAESGRKRGSVVVSLAGE